MNGVDRIAAERLRQVSQEGWTAEHDDEHDDGSLAMVAALFASPEPLFARSEEYRSVVFSDPWPSGWHNMWDKRPYDRRGELYPHGETATPQTTAKKMARIKLLAKAGALIAAEIDRLERKISKPKRR